MANEKILVVEPDSGVLGLLLAYLTRQRYIVTSALSAAVLLERLTGIDDEFDVIVANPQNAAALIAAHDGPRSMVTPLVVISNFPPEGYQNVETVVHLEKPFKPGIQVVGDTIRRILDDYVEE